MISWHQIALETHLQLVDFLVVAKEGVGADAGSALGLFLACCLSQVSPGPISLNAKTSVFSTKKADSDKNGVEGQVASIQVQVSSMNQNPFDCI